MRRYLSDHHRTWGSLRMGSLQSKLGGIFFLLFLFSVLLHLDIAFGSILNIKLIPESVFFIICESLISFYFISKFIVRLRIIKMTARSLRCSCCDSRLYSGVNSFSFVVIQYEMSFAFFF